MPINTTSVRSAGGVFKRSAGGARTRIFGGGPDARLYFAATVFDDYIYLLGGYRWSIAASDCDLWRTRNGVNWQRVEIDSDLGELQYHGFIVHNDKLYVAYGESIWESSDGATWTEKTDSAEYGNRKGRGLVSLGTNLYLFSGGGGAGLSNDLWEGGTDGEEWTDTGYTTSINKLDTDVHALVYDDKIWVLGGRVTASGSSNIFYTDTESDFVQTSETEEGFLSNTSLYHATTVHNDKMYVAFYDKLYYSSNGTSWTLTEDIEGLPNLPEANPNTNNPVMLSYRGSLYYFCGYINADSDRVFAAYKFDDDVTWDKLYETKYTP